MEAKKVESALTVEEWGGLDVYRTPSPEFRRKGQPPVTLTKHALFIGEHRNSVEIDRKRNEPLFHALAALCLHDQPFGFTWEDVEAIRGAVFVLRDQIDRGNIVMDDRGVLDDLAGRLAALLPPREDT